MPYARDIPSPDYYQVIWGKGLILLQREETGGTVSAYKVTAEEMQHVLIPPWMGHLAINTGQEPLVFANISVRSEHTNYQPFLTRRGAAFYMVGEGNGTSFVQNPNYPAASLGELRPNKNRILGDFDDEPLYRLLRDKNSTLRFLTRPDYFMDWFAQCLK